MALTSWKAFKFFEGSEVHVGDEKVSKEFSTGAVSSACTGSDNLFLGTSDGEVHILSKHFKVIRSFKAYENGSINNMRQLEGSSLLVTVGEDLSNDPVLKVWALDKVEKKTGAPRCQTTIDIQNKGQQFPITAFAAASDLSQVAVGFGNGSVTVIRGDFIHDRGTKQRVIFESEEPITGVEFREGPTVALYIATTGRILTLIISGKGQGQPARTLDENGCAVKCMAVDPATRDIVVGRDSGVHFYSLHGKRGSPVNADGEKQLLTIYKDYVVLLSKTSTSSISKSSLGAFSVTPESDMSTRSTLTLLNNDFHLIAHTEVLPSKVKFCFAAWGDLFVVTVDGSLHQYHERSMQQKFDLLFQRDLYILAIQMAKKAGVDSAQQNIILRKYGDHLYQHRDYDTAMQQYLQAIENTDPSQVIRKFLDTQRIHNLIDYLEELHERGRASPDHTILLLNCYAKLKDVEKLESFIKAPGDLKFDLDTAILMCRQGGYFDQAAYLARKHSEHDLVVSILVEDCKRYAEAIAYIWRLEPDSAFKNFSRYATVLLEHCSEDTTNLFTDYYTGKFRPKKDAVVVTAAPAASTTTNFAASAVQNLVSLLPLPYMSMDSSQQDTSTDQKTETHVVESQTDDPPPVYQIPRPRAAFSAFVDHPNEFIQFLEACLGSESLKEEDKMDIYTTLFEVYLHLANGAAPEERRRWQSQATQLIQSQKTYINASNVLLLSDLEEFHEGTVLVKEQQGLRFDIFRSYTSANDTAGAIKALRKYGPEEPQLYPAALAYFTSSPEILKEAGSEFEMVLRKIDEDGLMAPLQVIQTLSNNAVATMDLVKNYLQTTIGKEREDIANNRRRISMFRTDTARKRTELVNLSTTPKVFTANRCSSCGYALDMPVVHFLCEHSFHQRCLNTAEDEGVETVECPICAPQNANIRLIKKAQGDYKDRHDLFKEELGRSRNGFSTIAEWFGRGVVSTAPAEYLAPEEPGVRTFT